MTDFRRKLMQYHDGELDAVSGQQLNRRLLWDASGRRYLSELGTLGEAVRDAVRQATPEQDLTRDIMARIEADEPRERRRGLPPRLSGWCRRLASPPVLGLGSMAALAAVALLWLAQPVPQDSTPRGVALGDTVAGGQVRSLAEPGVAIESVDFGPGGGSIFVLERGRETTPVVWLSEPAHAEVRSGSL